MNGIMLTQIWGDRSHTKKGLRTYAEIVALDQPQMADLELHESHMADDPFSRDALHMMLFQFILQLLTKYKLYLNYY